MKNLTTILILLLACILSSCKDTKDNTKLIIATSADYPPFEYKLKGELTGFDIDLGIILAQELNKEPAFLDMEFSAVLASVQSGIADVAIATITATDERKKNFDFSDPYYTESLAILFPHDSPLLQSTDLAGKKIACQLGTTMELWLKNNAKDSEIITTDSNPQAVESLKAGHVDGVFIDAIQARAFSQKNPQLAYQVMAQADSGYVIVLKKNSPLKEPINKALKKLIKQGKINDLKRKYLEIKP
ncbi:MAG TPA: ABC transporter substrate-binding protein [Gammaproteobacteria bacterium]|nr:ABC transporter substrate-binding protein [Gammaproteobacteria bacterium]